MRHHKAKRIFGRVKKVRTALISSLALALLTKKKIKTTDAKAREIRPFVEKLITSAKKETLASKRALISKIGEVGTKKAIEAASLYKDRNGGFLRITKLPRRGGDASLMAYVEFV